MKLPHVAIRNFRFTLIVFILLAIWGISSFFTMPRTENPTVFIPGASIVVIYPGANPSDLENLVAIPIEESVNELDDIIDIETSIRTGIVTVTVEFAYETDPDDKFDEVIRQVNSIRNKLPQDIYDLFFWQFSSSDVAMLQYALVSESAAYKDIKKKADKLKSSLEQIAGVKKVEILALPEQEIHIIPDFQKMAFMNVALRDIINAVESNNMNIPGGALNMGNKSFNVLSSGSFKNIEEIKNVVVGNHQGNVVYLKDFAKVVFANEDQNYLARFNGMRSVFLTVKQKEGLNIFHLMEDINPVIAEYRSKLSENYQLHTVFDQSKIVDNRISGFMGNLTQGILVVGLLILILLGIRSALIVILAIPLSIFVGLGFIDLYGLGLQQITIAALVVALGLLVDNSIVIIENIERHLRMKKTVLEAAVDATSEVGWAVLAATATTLLAFIPIALMPDKAGDFIEGLPITIIATLGISLLIALTLNPLIISLLYKIKNRKRKGKGISNISNLIKGKLNNWIEIYYQNILRKSLKRKKVVVVIAIGSFLGATILFFLGVGISFFPGAETPQMMIEVELPEGSNLEKTNETVKYVESVLDTMPLIKHYATNVGHGNPRIYYNEFSKNYAKNYAQLYLELTKYEVHSFNKLVNELRDFFADYDEAEVKVKTFEQGVPINAPVELYIKGENLDSLKNISAEIEQWFYEIDGLININNKTKRERTDLHFKINKDKALLFGVYIHEIDMIIRAVVNGMEVSKYRSSDGEEFPIIIRMGKGKNIDIQELDKVYVKSAARNMIPLKQFVDVKFKKASNEIIRYNMHRNAVIQADIREGITLDAVLEPLQRKLKTYSFPEGYSYHISGELEARNETFGGMGKAVIIAIISIFAVLVLQFKSFKQPLIIFAAIPLAIIGSVLALFLTGYTFSFTAFIGLISLVGIVINNSIILVDYSNQLVAKGLPLNEAVIQAAKTRLTPILLTTLTTIGGLLPLTLQGGEMWAPLGWTIIGGLLVSTMLTLIVIPVLYELLSKESEVLAVEKDEQEIKSKA